jgi:hypothetical protein
MHVLTEFNIAAVLVVVAFILGVLFSTKIKDWFKGIPTDVRKGLTQVETAVRAKLSASHAVAVTPAILAVTPPVIPVPHAAVEAAATAIVAAAPITGLTGPA